MQTINYNAITDNAERKYKTFPDKFTWLVAKNIDKAEECSNPTKDAVQKA